MPLAFMNFNFLSDGYSLTPVPTNVGTVDSIQLQNGIMDRFEMTTNVLELPTTFWQWDYNTILDARFNGTIDAGNSGDIENIIANITSVKIKRRVQGEFDWLTIAEIPINSPEDFVFTFNDTLNANYTDYEYAWVPVMEGVEGEYQTETVASQFQGIFICDLDTVYKFYMGVSYGDTTRAQKVGTFEPFGQQYPVIVSNGAINYETGSVSGRIMPPDYTTTGTINRQKIVAEKKILLDFLTNKKAKILKDWNGQMWLLIVTGTPSVSYDSNYGMGMMTASFDWTEIGDPTNQQDLYNSGIIDVLS